MKVGELSEEDKIKLSEWARRTHNFELPIHDMDYMKNTPFGYARPLRYSTWQGEHKADKHGFVHYKDGGELLDALGRWMTNKEYRQAQAIQDNWQDESADWHVYVSKLLKKKGLTFTELNDPVGEYGLAWVGRGRPSKRSLMKKYFKIRKDLDKWDKDAYTEVPSDFTMGYSLSPKRLREKELWNVHTIRLR